MALADVDITLEDLSLRPELRGAHAYGAPQLTVPIRLNTNENPYSPSQTLQEELVARIAEHAAELNRYPERDAVALRTALATYISKQTGVPVSYRNVWAANGSNEILQQLLQAFGGPDRKVLGFQPSYSMHPILSQGTHTEFINCPRDAEFNIDMPAALEAIAAEQPDVVFITTPNNPTGGCTSLEDIAQLVAAAPGIVIVDEAYAEFSPAPSALELVEQFPEKLVISRTMSKAFDFAGGRLGYFVAHEAFIEAVMLVRLPYHLSVLSQIAAEVALEHSADTLATVAEIVEQRDQVQQQLIALGYTVIPSAANFIFFGGFEDQHAVWQQFLDAGVLIRDVGIPGWLRVTIGLPEENVAFVDAATSIAPTALTPTA